MEPANPARASPGLRATADALSALTDALQAWNAAHLGGRSSSSELHDDLLAEHRALHVEFQALHARDMVGDVSPSAHAGFRARIAHLIDRLRETRGERR